MVWVETILTLTLWNELYGRVVHSLQVMFDYWGLHMVYLTGDGPYTHDGDAQYVCQQYILLSDENHIWIQMVFVIWKMRVSSIVQNHFVIRQDVRWYNIVYAPR